jgi:hypothetical protein
MVRDAIVLRALAVTLAVAPWRTARAAEEPPRIVVIDSGQRALVERMRVELVTMGFQAITVPNPATGALSSLAGLTRDHRAVAVIRLVWAEEALQVLLFDARTGQSFVGRVGGTEEPIGPVALRVVEMLRAKLLELAMPDTVAAGASPPSPATRVAPASKPAEAAAPPSGGVAAAPQNPWGAAATGFGALASRGGLSPEAAIAVSVEALLGHEIRAGIVAFVPVSSMKHEAAEGSSSSRAFVFGADVQRRAGRRTWHVTLGGGPSLSVLALSGRGSGPLYRDAGTTLVAAGGYLRAGVSHDLSRTFAVRAQGVRDRSHVSLNDGRIVNRVFGLAGPTRRRHENADFHFSGPSCFNQHRGGAGDARRMRREPWHRDRELGNPGR